MTLAEAEKTMQAAAAKASDLDTFHPYLRAAIVYWRLRAEATDDAEDLVDATTERIAFEERFREIAGRPFHVVHDAIDYEDVASL